MSASALTTLLVAVLGSGATLAPAGEDAPSRDATADEVAQPEGETPESGDGSSAGEDATAPGEGGDEASGGDGASGGDEAGGGDEASGGDEPASDGPDEGDAPSEAGDGETGAEPTTGESGGGAGGGGSASAGAGGGAAPPASGASGGGAAAGGGSSGPLASGSVRSDDDEFYEPEPEPKRRRRRGRRDPERSEEGQWQVFAPFPELGRIRYRDPEVRRTVWLGIDAAGAWLPESLGLFDRTVWTVRPSGAWAIALAPWLALGGRHSVAWYDAQNIRTRVHHHQVELSGRPLGASRPDAALDDRLALGVSTHAIRWSEVDDLAIEPGGLDDTIVHLGYGLDHLMGTRWRLGWQAQVRYAWVYQDTQRHARLSTRLAFNPRPAHRVSAAAVGYYVHRDAEQLGNPLPRHSVYGQFGLGYAWVANAGVGPGLDLRYNTGFMSGEAPVYEIREEALNTDYGEVLVGMMARWQ